MEPSQKIQTGNVLSYLGRDYVVEGLLTYKVAGKVYRLARAVDGDTVLWVEPLTDELDDRVLLMTEVSDLDIATPPPSTISYRQAAFVPRWSGAATVEAVGNVGDRAAGTRDVWRYRAAGDVFVQIEAASPKPLVLYGESAHKGMIELLPGK